jgi:hypothetical protein
MMGMYGREMIVASPGPVVLPKLCVALWVVSDVGDVPKQLRVRVLIPPNRVEVAAVEMDVPLEAFGAIEAGTKKLQLFANVQIANVLIPEAGYIEVFVDSGFGDNRAGRMMIRFAEPVASYPAVPGQAPVDAAGGPNPA